MKKKVVTISTKTVAEVRIGFTVVVVATMSPRRKFAKPRPGTASTRSTPRRPGTASVEIKPLPSSKKKPSERLSFQEFIGGAQSNQ